MNTLLRLVSFSLILAAFVPTVNAQDNVGIGTTTPHPNSILDVSATDKGMMVPRLNTLQRLAMANPPFTTLPGTADGLLVYDTDIEQFCYWNDDLVDWVCFGQGGTGSGSTGPTGPQGPQGPAGANGANGATGPAGANGATGPAGPTGPQGPAGANGATGPQGPTGPSGGPVGPTGPAGATGPAGPAGVNGATGPAGPAGANGATGPVGPAGANGATGPAGPAGANGATGPAGPAGPAGAQGPAGAAGPQGPAGPTGPSAANNTTTVNLASLTQLTQAPSGSISYVQLPDLTYSFVVPAGQTWHVFASAFGTVLNLGSFNDCTAQFQFFENGTGTGKLQRTYIADLSTELTFAYGTWAISYTKSYGPGSYTLDVRGAHAGPTGGTNIQLAGASGGFQAHMELIIVKP